MKKKNDILFLCQFFYPEYISSATLPFDTAEALVKEGFSVNVLCGYPKEYSEKDKVLRKEKYNGIEIKRVKYIQMKRSHTMGRLVNYFSFTLSVFLHFFSMRDYKSIIVYSNPPILPLIATLASKIFGCKLIFVCYDIYPEIAIRTRTISENSIISKVMNFINRLLYRNVTKVVALSNDMKNFLLKNRNQLDKNQVVVIPNWYEDKKNNSQNPYNNVLFKKIMAKDKLVISYFGNMGIAQDLNTLIDAMVLKKNDHNVVFVFAGHGNKLSFLKEVVRKNDLTNIYIYDFLRGKDFEDALSISDVFVVSLNKGLTGLAVPSKTYSYMMAGKPIISIMNTEADISKDLIDYQAGYGIEVGDVSKLISIIDELKINPKMIDAMGNNAQVLFHDKYTKEKCTTKYVEMMKEILEDF